MRTTSPAGTWGRTRSCRPCAATVGAAAFFLAVGLKVAVSGSRAFTSAQQDGGPQGRLHTVARDSVTGQAAAARHPTPATEYQPGGAACDVLLLLREQGKLPAAYTLGCYNGVIVYAGMYYCNHDPATPDDTWFNTFPFDVDNWRAAAEREALEVKVGLGHHPACQPHTMPARCYFR